MKLSTALLASLKYNILALIPTGLGIGVALGGLWFGGIAPLLTMVQSGGITALLQGSVTIPSGFNPLLVVGGVVGGYLVYRVGRTALLFKLQGSALDIPDE